MSKEEIKLTPKQNMVMYCLQNGWELITNNDMKGAVVGNRKYEFRINNGVFFRLYNMELIFQNPKERFQYTLTELGKKLKTKPVNITTHQ